MACNNISFWYKPCSWCWAKWIRRMECARICERLHILSHLVPVCTDLSNLFDSVVLLRWDMQTCQNRFWWEDLGHLHAVWFVGARGLWSALRLVLPFWRGQAGIVLLEHIWSLIINYILSPLGVSGDLYLPGFILNAVFLPLLQQARVVQPEWHIWLVPDLWTTCPIWANCTGSNVESAERQQLSGTCCAHLTFMLSRRFDGKTALDHRVCFRNVALQINDTILANGHQRCPSKAPGTHLPITAEPAASAQAGPQHRYELGWWCHPGGIPPRLRWKNHSGACLLGPPEQSRGP